VAGLAFLRFVSPFKGVTCQVVVECGFAEPDDLEIAAMVVIVANYAFFRSDILRSMVSLVEIHPFF
jgi:hypothetical protein